MGHLLLFIGKLLPPVDNGLNFHQTRESAAETARTGIAEEFCDVGQGLARVCEQLTSHIQANLRKHCAIACAHTAEMTLQRPRADLANASCAIYGCVTLSQRRDNGRADRLGRRQTDGSHLSV
ncbi:hypothetical protein BE61_87670 [Bradyrhizobium elkanii USDA 61]|nr:hypothetical protein BE61_87670 [Bradyrhizobium elkanii USDA 61]